VSESNYERAMMAATASGLNSSKISDYLEQCTVLAASMGFTPVQHAHALTVLLALAVDVAERVKARAESN
jgi:hypothetical protein